MATDHPARVLTFPDYNMTAEANVLGVAIDAVDISRATDRIELALERREKGYVCVTGVHGVMEAQNNASFKNVLNSSLLTVPDGMPTVWVGKLQGFRQIKRVFGPDLMIEVCKRSVQKGYTHFLYGGAPGIAEQLQQALQARFPGIKIVGLYTPPYRPLNETEFSQLKETVAKVSPDFFWVGLSTPKQEMFMADSLPQLSTRVMIGVGAAFDIHTGHLRDAPNWIKVVGMQWAHRLAQEPKRLWKRYLANNPRFMWAITLQLIRVRRHNISTQMDSR